MKMKTGGERKEGKLIGWEREWRKHIMWMSKDKLRKCLSENLLFPADFFSLYYFDQFSFLPSFDFIFVLLSYCFLNNLIPSHTNTHRAKKQQQHRKGGKERNERGIEWNTPSGSIIFLSSFPLHRASLKYVYTS